MADVFSQFDAKSLLIGKYVLFIGDSNTRAQYKDLLWLLTSNTLMSKSSMRTKADLKFLGEQLVTRSEINQSRTFKEIRLINFEDTGTMLEFVFTTRCFNNQLKELFNSIRNKNKPTPDILVMNSCVWDLSRWGPNGVPSYKDNMVKLMRLVKQTLPRECLVIWTTALPLAAHVRGGLLIKQMSCMEPMLRFEVMEANTFAREVVVNHGFDVLDHHFHTRMQMHRRSKDGIHYMPVALRLLTNLLLTHISLSWGSELPNNIKSVLLDKAIAQVCRSVLKSVVVVPNTGLFSKINLRSPVVPQARGLKITVNVGEGKTLRNCKLNFDEKIELKPEEVTNPTPQTTAMLQKRQHPRIILDNQKQPEHGPVRKKNKDKRKTKRNNPY